MMASMSDNLIVLSGYQKKLKTMKKKFFVLYKGTPNNPARLEYYDHEKKFTQGAEAKRIIYLKNCFNINRRYDTKHKFVLALSYKEGGFGIVLNSESELRKWLDNLLSIQRDNANSTDQVYIPYDNVWQVVVQKKGGMSESAGITGSYHCCLTPKSLTFICIGPEKYPNGEDRLPKVEILLTTVRRCGHASPQNIFYMELGRQSVLGSGELWMQTEDATIAKNMHDTILCAMSAKTESNMNLLNVYKGKPDISNEPMRKRSSSATEASKPINVLQKRQNPIEIRNSFSPQYNSYGRERCDSLPTRNRTLSECSNQTYSALKHGHRSYTLSGTRTYATNQRHNESPPIATPMKCSESEESSISIDESDDKGMFDYRITSRTSKAAIPEENMDELGVSDGSKCSQTNENFENYISMTPNNATCENINANHMDHCVVGPQSRGVTDSELNIDFPEQCSDKFSRDAETDNQYGRPTRTYSMGNKVEHTKMRKLYLFQNEMDNSSHRERAWSVGSKSKIPRCDIQRGVLFSNVKKGLKGSNCNMSVDIHCSDVVGTPREMKSTSAPLLNLRPYINSDRMSDLMEIDFSNATLSSTAASQQLKSSKNFQVANLTQKNNIPNAYSVSNGNIKQEESPNKLQPQPLPLPLPLPQLARNSCVDSSTENGYLEMKPVGVSNLNTKPSSLEDQIKRLRLQQPLQSPQEDTVDNCYSEMGTGQGAVKPIMMLDEEQAKRRMSDNSRPETSTELSKNIQLNTTTTTTTTEKLDSSSPVETETKLDNNKLQNKTILNFALDVSSAATNSNTNTSERKLIHSISNEDYTKHINKSNETADPDKDVGYQILQIKSDSSLISKKNKIQRPIYNKPQQPCGRQALLESVHNNTTDEKILKTKSSNTNINTNNTKSNLLLKTSTNTIKKDTASSSENASTKDENESSSSSGICAHELYYASLDLPQSSGQITTKCLKSNTSCESPPVAVSFENRSLYAKIDFDQSDSSSASSKIFNV